MKIKYGATRWVLLIGKYAIKFPSFYSWRSFLQGVLGNEQEVTWSEFLNDQTDKFCPVLWSMWGCFVIVMPRCTPISMDDYTNNRLPEIMEEYIKVDQFLTIPAEAKEDSFGWLNGRLVAVDYGS